MMPIDVGADAPDFTLKTSTGEDFRLSDVRGMLRVMMIFYPKDFTPGCTDQLIKVRKDIQHIRKAGIEPVGVNPGDAKTHEKFREAHALNFDLLVDEDAEVAKAYGAIKPEGVGILRSVIIVGKNGRVVYSKEGKPPWQLIINAMREVDDEPTEFPRNMTIDKERTGPVHTGRGQFSRFPTDYAASRHRPASMVNTGLAPITGWCRSYSLESGIQ